MSTPNSGEGSTRSAKVSSKNQQQSKESIATLHLLKTKLCTYHQNGSCRYGKECHFAHRVEELRTEVDLKKTSLCKDFLAHKCPLSAKDCRFAHRKRELRRVLPQEMLDAIEAQKATKPSRNKRDKRRTEFPEGLELQRLLTDEVVTSGQPCTLEYECPTEGSGDQEWCTDGQAEIRRPTVLAAGLYVKRAPSFSSPPPPCPWTSESTKAAGSSTSSWSGEASPSFADVGPCSPRSSEGHFEAVSARGSPWSGRGTFAGVEVLDWQAAGPVAESHAAEAAKASPVTVRSLFAYQAPQNLNVPTFVWQNHVFMGTAEDVLKQAAPTYYTE